MYYIGFILIKKSLLLPVFLIFICAIFKTSLFAQDNPKDRLNQAEGYYKSAKFDNAIEILTGLSSEQTSDTAIRKEALRFLGRTYTAKGLYNEAKDALTKLLKLEPPMIVFNPDYEPPVFMKLYYQTRKEATGSYQVEKPDPGIKTLAIIDFKNRSVTNKTQYDPMEQGFADLFISRLNDATGLKVIERERIQWILDEIKMQNQYDMEGAVRVGKQLGVQSVLMGSFIIVKDKIWLGARLVKVETSEILLTDEVNGDVDDFFTLVDNLGKKISEKINVKLKDTKEAQVSKAPSLEAVMAYSIGLSYLEKEDYKDAYAKFQEALKYDPEYEKARMKAESITPYL